jgi:TolB protein
MKGLLWSLNRNQRRWLNKGIFLAVLYLFGPSAEARIYIQVDQPSEKKFPIAVANLVPVNRGSSKKWSREIPEIIKKDLQLTALFDIIPEEQYPNSPGALSPNPATIQFPPWTLIGVQALVTGSYTNAGKGMQIEMHLYDPFLGQHLLGRTYTTTEKELSVVANHFADEIMQELTGERGVFSTKIAYTQVMKRRKEIGVMDMNGMNSGTVTKDGTISLSPAWSPSGQIAYSTLDKGGNWQIALVGGRRVTTGGNLNISPAWTPSGALTIASAMHGDTDIYLINMSGNVIRRLTDSYGIDVNPAWAPDGSAFVFASERGGRLHLFKGGAGGGGAERLTFVGSQNDNPAWSPKGDKIAFQSLAGGWDIFVMNTDGSMIQRLTSQGCESPTWAPNGRFIAASCGGRVTIMREDGSNPTPVGPGGSVQPAWGPWGK